MSLDNHRHVQISQEVKDLVDKLHTLLQGDGSTNYHANVSFGSVTVDIHGDLEPSRDDKDSSWYENTAIHYRQHTRSSEQVGRIKPCGPQGGY